MAMNLLLLSALGGLAQSPGLARVCVRIRSSLLNAAARTRTFVAAGVAAGGRAKRDPPRSLSPRGASVPAPAARWTG